MFLWRDKKNMDNFWLKKKSYLVIASMHHQNRYCWCPLELRLIRQTLVLLNPDMFAKANSVDPDQLRMPTDLDLHYLP